MEIVPVGSLFDCFPADVVGGTISDSTADATPGRNLAPGDVGGEPFEFGGRVTSLAVDEGDRVRSGDVLGAIDGAVDAAASTLLEELLPRVEARLSFAVHRQRRALVGVSMGAFGALQFALSQPQRFCAAALISPAVYDPLPPLDSAARRTPQFVRDGKFDEQLWQVSNYPGRLAVYRRAPQKVAFWISSGDRDQPEIVRAATQLFARLYALQPDRTELRLMPGGHNWAAFDAALAPALAYIDGRCR